MTRVNDKRSMLPLSGKDRASSSRRQPGAGAFASQQVPAGIEQLLGMAASDAAFATALVERPQEAIAASGVSLSPAEQAVLAATPEAALRHMVEGVGQQMPQSERRSFLSLAGAAVLLLAGGGIAAAGCKEKGANQGGSAAPGMAPPESPMEPPAVAMRPMTTRPIAVTPQPMRRARPEVSLTGILPGRRGPTVVMGTGKVTDGIDMPVVRRVIRRHQRELKYCYVTQYLGKGHKAADGALTVQFTIDAAGKVKQATVKTNSTGNQDFAKCVTQALLRWRYPKPSNGKIVRVSWRFNLTAGVKKP